MQVCVSYGTSSSTGSLRSLILPEEIKRLLDRVCKLCGKVSVAKVDLSPSSVSMMLIMRSTPLKQKELSQLVNLCGTLNNHLGDRSLILQQSNYDDIKRPVHHSPSTHLPLT